MSIITIPTRNELIRVLPPRSTIAEVGVWRGYFSTQILELPNIKHLYLVDSWRPRPEYNDPLSDTDHEANLKETLHNIRGHLPGGRVDIIRLDSLESVHNFHDSELDCAYLDADHSFDATLANLRAWSRVVKPTGMIAGHDFCDSHHMAVKYGWGVEKAVAQFCSETNWKLKYVTAEDFRSFGLVQV